MSASIEQLGLAAIMFTNMVGYSGLSQRDDLLRRIGLNPAQALPGKTNNEPPRVFRPHKRRNALRPAT
jgi:hypothetical protein